jgi:hypothetical protein
LQAGVGPDVELHEGVFVVGQLFADVAVGVAADLLIGDVRARGDSW